MNIDISNNWTHFLREEFEKEYFKELLVFIENAYETYQCFPPKNEIFNAFNHCNFEDIKVVIIGQDPYHGPDQANGLCFSVNKGIKHPPSLINIFKEIENDVGVVYPSSGDLSPWAKQGILLLNATLTVRSGAAGSHQKKGWETFTNNLIRIISREKKDVIFLLWGGYAKQKEKLIDKTKHDILYSGHPSPLSANRGYWFGNQHFSKVNTLLMNKKKSPIDWILK